MPLENFRLVWEATIKWTGLSNVVAIQRVLTPWFVTDTDCKASYSICCCVCSERVMCYPELILLEDQCEQRRDMIRHSLGKGVSPEVAHLILRRSIRARGSGERGAFWRPCGHWAEGRVRCCRRPPGRRGILCPKPRVKRHPRQSQNTSQVVGVWSLAAAEPTKDTQDS